MIPYTAVDNGADAGQVKRATRQQKLARLQEMTDLRKLLSLPEGRRFLWRLIERCKIYQSIWAEGTGIHFNEGQRNVGLFVMHEVIAADNTALLKMMSEAAARDLEQQRQAEHAQTKTKPQTEDSDDGTETT